MLKSPQFHSTGCHFHSTSCHFHSTGCHLHSTGALTRPDRCPKDPIRRGANATPNRSAGRRHWRILEAQTLLNTPDVTTTKGLRDRAILAVLLGCGLRPVTDHVTPGSSRGAGGLSPDLPRYVQLSHPTCVASAVLAHIARKSSCSPAATRRPQPPARRFSTWAMERPATRYTGCWWPCGAGTSSGPCTPGDLCR